MDVQTCLKNFKLISATQVDLSYFNNIVPTIFPDSSVYISIQSDVQFINQIGNTLFNYFNQKDQDSQKIWFEALRAGLMTAFSDAQSLIEKVPTEKQEGKDLVIVLQELLNDYDAIKAIIPPRIEKK